MANRRSNIDLILRASVRGQSEVERLTTEFRTLEGQAGEVAVEVRQLFDQLTRLRQQEGLAREFDRLNVSLATLEDRINRDVQALTQLQAEIAQTGSASAAQARQLQRLQASIDRSSRSYDQQKVALQQVNQAIRATGVSVGTLTANQAQVRTAVGTATAALERQTATLKRLKAEQANVGRGAQGFFAIFTAGNLAASAIARVADAIREGAREFVRANAEYEQFTRTLNLINESTIQTAGDFQFLREQAEITGAPVRELARSFIRFKAAADNSNISADVLKNTFSVFSQALANTGASSTEVTRALRALEQSLSKGKFAAEEIRQQLGEVLPGANNLLAESLGVTSAALDKLFQQGQVFSNEENLVNFTNTVGEAFGATGENIDTFNADLGRLRQALDEAFLQIGEAGLFDALRSGLQSLTELVNALAGPLSSAVGIAVDVFETFGGAITTIAGIALTAKLIGWANATKVFGTALTGAGAAATGYTAQINRAQAASARFAGVLRTLRAASPAVLRCRGLCSIYRRGAGGGRAAASS